MSHFSDFVKSSELPSQAKVATLRYNELLGELEDSKVQAEEDRVRNQALLNSLGEGLLVINEDGIITTVNPKACQILGFSEAELLGQWYPRAVRAVDPKGNVIPTLQRYIMQSLLQGEPISGQTRFVRKNGEIIPVAKNVAPVIVQGKPVGAIEVFRDITQELALEKAKDDFVSLASHQLRTPATAVKAILSMLVSGDFGEISPRQQHFLTKAIATNDRQLEIIEDMLQASRIDAGKMKLSIETVGIVSLCSEVVREQLHNIELQKQTINIYRPTEELYVKADSTKLRMVLENLVHNAHKYTPTGGRIDIRTVGTNNTVKVEVSDTGVGIKEADLDKLFNKFSRIENQLSAKVGGSGLGLYLVKHIVGLHKGTVQVESEPGQGSVFTVELPIAGYSNTT